MKVITAFTLLIVIFTTACNTSVKPGDLYGKWKYTKVENPTADPPDSVSSAELIRNNPSIEFTRSNQLIISWGGKILSQGTFITNGRDIQYTEKLPGGKTRTFPFYVSKLNSREIEFETKGDNKFIVKATKIIESLGDI